MALAATAETAHRHPVAVRRMACYDFTMNRRSFLAFLPALPAVAIAGDGSSPMEIAMAQSEAVRHWHIGGYVGGLKPGEFAAILPPNESILPLHMTASYGQSHFRITDHPTEEIISVYVGDEPVYFGA